MLKRVKILKYRCLRDLDVPLRPLTVLIGPNDSGKSAFLNAMIHFTEHRNFQMQDWWRMDKQNQPNLTAFLTDSSRIDVGPNGVPLVTPQGAEAAIQPSVIYRLPSEGTQIQSSGLADTAGPPPLGPKGENLAALLDYVYRHDHDRYVDFVEAMKGLVPGLKMIRISFPDPSSRRIDLELESGFGISAEQASTGVRYLLFFVALAYHPTPPRLILIEEPENGLHPKRLGDVVRLLREITQGKHGNHAAQVILSTHSPHLLDYVDLETDQVLVFRREEDGSRSATPVDRDRLKNFLDEFMLGEVWYNEGEAGLVGPKS